MMFALCEQKVNFLLTCGHRGGHRGGQRGGHLGVTWGSLAIKIPKMSKNVIAETSAKTSLGGDVCLRCVLLLHGGGRTEAG